MSCPKVIRIVTPGPAGPGLTLTGPAVAGRATGTGPLVPIPLGTGLAIVDGMLTSTGVGVGSGTVTSVGLSVPTGLSITNSPITGAGTLTVTYAPGYSLPTTAKQGQWDQAYIDLGQPRPPSSHKSTHSIGGSDALTAADIGAATAAQGAKADTAVQPSGLTKAAVGLGNVDNTSDADKPISTATAAALATKADTNSVTLLSSATPQALGTATAGTATEASRADHRHAMPSATQVGADASGTATAAVAAHAAEADPHPGYALETDSRLSDPRTPTEHKSTHATGGTDALSPADIGAATAAQGAKADTAVQPAGLTKAAVGLGNADNTSDANKPVSTATATALAGKVDTTDSRLSDARTPTAHNQAWSTITGTPTTLSGYGITGAVGTVTTGITGAAEITNIISISQSNYDAIPTKNAQTLYVISG